MDVVMVLQVGLSAMYDSLRGLPEDICSQCDALARDALDSVKVCAFAALYSDDVIKEAAVSAAGALWAMAKLRFQAPPDAMAATFARGLFHARLGGCTLQRLCSSGAAQNQGGLPETTMDEVCCSGSQRLLASYAMYVSAFQWLDASKRRQL